MEEKRFPVSVRLLGVMHKEENKLYMTSVLWSDQNEIIIYRKLEDFKTLHKQLKKKYAPSNPLRKSSSIVPKFKVDAGGKAAQKTLSKSVTRLRALEHYCHALLNSDPRVSRSAELALFLQPRADELKPEFAQNSILIMPSDESLGTRSPGGSDAGVTQPFVTETYRCIAPYETKDTKNRPFKVEVDETVDVLIKDKGGWWLVENETKCLAWFPAPYLEKAEIDDEGDELDDDESALYVVSRSYKSAKSDELSVEMGIVVEVLQRSDNGWWLIRYNRRVGYVPAMYLQPYTHPQVRILSTQREFRGSSLNLAQLQPPSSASSLHVPMHELSRSQGNLLQIPGSGSGGGGGGLHEVDKAKSRSTGMLPDVRPAPSTPVIRIQPDEKGRAGSLSEGSDSSFSDEGSSFSIESSSNSFSEARRSRTPPPIVTDRLSPDSASEGKLTPSTSDPNMFKPPGTPKVPPRPQAQEILKRCTTVTRKNASKNQQVSTVHSR